MVPAFAVSASAAMALKFRRRPVSLDFSVPVAIDVMTLSEKLAKVVDEKGLNLRAEDLKQFGARG